LRVLFNIFLFFGEIGLDLDVSDEPQWYIPAGIDPSDLQRSLTVIEQFEKAPLDLEGKRAAQLLHKKRRSRRRRTEGEAKDDDDDDDDDGRKQHKVARKAREREKYMSAQFIEDSDEEYGRDIEEFFAREAAVRERTALAAIDSLSHIGTMRPTGTKKRRRRQPSLGTTTAAGAKGSRVAKRSRRSALSSSGMHDVDGEEQGEGGDHGGFNAGALRPSPAAAASDDDDDGGDDGSGGGDIGHDSDRSSRSFLAHRDVAAAKHRHSDPPLVVSQKRPKARPRYRGVPIASQAPDNTIPGDTSPRRGTDDDDVGQAQQQGQDQSPSTRATTTPVLPPSIDHKGDIARQATITSASSSNGGGPPKGRTRSIISDEEE
jgi:hypothetical protein